ncbi:MAG TPA: DUF2550 domain-containing protein [Acidothermaceae bacterium]
MRVVLDFVDGAGWIVVFAVVLLIAFVVRRGAVRRRGATLHCGLRMGVTATNPSSRGWHTGMARYTPEDLEWFRLLSLRYQPNLTFVRRSIEITSRRDPRGAETFAVPRDAVIVTCNVITRAGDPLSVEFAMSDAAVTGFLAWIESSAPGAHSHPDTRV